MYNLSYILRTVKVLQTVQLVLTTPQIILGVADAQTVVTKILVNALKEVSILAFQIFLEMFLVILPEFYDFIVQS